MAKTNVANPGMMVQGPIDVTVRRVAVKDLQDRLQAFTLLNTLKVSFFFTVYSVLVQQADTFCRLFSSAIISAVSLNQPIHPRFISSCQQRGCAGTSNRESGSAGAGCS